MSFIRKVAGHTVLQVGGKFAGNIIGVIVVGLLTRYLGEEGFGNYTTILAYLFFFSSFADLGLYMITINEINKPGLDRSRFFSAVYSLRFFSGLALIIVATTAVWLLPYPALVKIGVAITSVSIFFNLLDQIQVALYQAELAMVRASIADIIGKAVLIIGVIVGIALKWSLLGLLWMVVVGHGVHFLINFFGIRRYITLRITIDKEQWRDIIAKTWPIALSQICVLVYFKMDAVLLSLLRPIEVAQTEVGLYGASYKFLEVSIAFIPLFMGLVAPILAHWWHQQNMQKFRELYQHIFNVFSVTTLPFVVGGVVLATPLMQLIAPGFEQSDTILRILMLAIGIIFFAHLPTYTINTIGQQRTMLSRYIAIAVFALVLYIIFIPLYSFYAAAWVTVLVELLILIFAWHRVQQVIRQRIQLSVFAKSLSASIIMGALLVVFINTNIFILICIGVVVYGVLLLLMKVVTKDMVVMLLSSRK